MTAVSSARKILADRVAKVFGGNPKVVRIADQEKTTSVDILLSADRPEDGLTSYGTVGLSEIPLERDGSEYPIRLELLGLCDNSCPEFANALATAAFFISRSKWFCCPGTIFPGILQPFSISPVLRHFFFVPPFAWDNELNATMAIEDREVTWLLAAPISDAERDYAREHGDSALEDLLIESNVDIADVRRKSVL